MKMMFVLMFIEGVCSVSQLKLWLWVFWYLQDRSLRLVKERLFVAVMRV